MNFVINFKNLLESMESNVQMETDQVQQSYRLVNKEYFCYVCQKKMKKMIQVGDLLNNGMLCDICGQGFCEIIDLDTDIKGMLEIGMV